MKKSRGLLNALIFCIVVSVFLSCFSGCRLFKSKSQAPVIEADDPWYSYEAFDMLSEYDSVNGGYIYSYSLGKYNNEFLSIVGVGDGDLSDGDSSFAVLNFFAENGDKVKTIDITTCIASENDEAIVTTYISDNILRLITWGNVYDLNLDIEELTRSDDNYTYSMESEETGIMSYVTLSHYLETDDYLVKFFRVSDVVNFYRIEIESDTDDIVVDLKNSPIENISTVFPIDSTTVGFINIGVAQHFYSLDLTSGSVTRMDDDQLAFLDDYYFNTVSYLEETNEVIGANASGFYKLDFANQKVELIFDWNWCTFDRTNLLHSKIIERTDNQLTIISASDYGNNSYVLFLTREETNPHAGKHIITIENGYYSSIARFNEQDDEYFVALEMKYDERKYYNDYYETDLDPLSYAYNADQQLNFQKAIDLINGDSPDLITSAATSSQLLSSEYLLDLSDYISSDSDYKNGLYFNNVLDAARINGKLLYIPLGFILDAIGTVDVNYSDVSGLTYEEYENFISTVCNGNEILADNKTDFMRVCLPTVLSYCIDEEGNVDFDNEAFRELATYTNANVHNRNGGNSYSGWGKEYRLAMRLQTYSTGDFLYCVSSEAWDFNKVNLLGYPNYDGSGIFLETDSTISISSNAKDPEGCYKFIKFLMSADELCNIYGPNGYGTNTFTINREAFYTLQSICIDNYNEECDYYNNMREETGFEYMFNPRINADVTLIDKVSSWIDECRYFHYSDPAINMIVYEEMQPYFAGDKTLNEVIVIMNDRAQTVINERG